MSPKLSIAQLAERTGRTRGTIENWISRGVSFRGRTVRLAATRVGGRYELTEAAFEAFVAACNPPRVSEADSETASARARRLEAGRAEALRLTGSTA